MKRAEHSFQFVHDKTSKAKDVHKRKYNFLCTVGFVSCFTFLFYRVYSDSLLI